MEGDMTSDFGFVRGFFFGEHEDGARHGNMRVAGQSLVVGDNIIASTDGTLFYVHNGHIASGSDTRDAVLIVGRYAPEGVVSSEDAPRVAKYRSTCPNCGNTSLEQVYDESGKVVGLLCPESVGCGHEFSPSDARSTLAQIDTSDIDVLCPFCHSGVTVWEAGQNICLTCGQVWGDPDAAAIGVDFPEEEVEKVAQVDPLGRTEYTTHVFFREMYQDNGVASMPKEEAAAYDFEMTGFFSSARAAADAALQVAWDKKMGSGKYITVEEVVVWNTANGSYDDVLVGGEKSIFLESDFSSTGRLAKVAQTVRWEKVRRHEDARSLDEMIKQAPLESKVCPKCKGGDIQCKRCGGSGYVHRYAQVMDNKLVDLDDPQTEYWCPKCDGQGTVRWVNYDPLPESLDPLGEEDDSPEDGLQCSSCGAEWSGDSAMQQYDRDAATKVAQVSFTVGTRVKALRDDGAGDEYVDDATITAIINPQNEPGWDFTGLSLYECTFDDGTVETNIPAFVWSADGMTHPPTKTAVVKIAQENMGWTAPKTAEAIISGPYALQGEDEQGDIWDGEVLVTAVDESGTVYGQGWFSSRGNEHVFDFMSQPGGYYSLTDPATGTPVFVAPTRMLEYIHNLPSKTAQFEGETVDIIDGNSLNPGDRVQFYHPYVGEATGTVDNIQDASCTVYVDGGRPLPWVPFTAINKNLTNGIAKKTAQYEDAGCSNPCGREPMGCPACLSGGDEESYEEGPTESKCDSCTPQDRCDKYTDSDKCNDDYFCAECANSPCKKCNKTGQSLDANSLRVGDIRIGQVDDKTETSVIFRRWNTGSYFDDIIAIFPDLNEASGAANPGRVMMYEHVGQHGEGDMAGVMAQTIPAIPEEYAELKSELEGLGYVFTSVKTAQSLDANALRVGDNVNFITGTGMAATGTITELRQDGVVLQEGYAGLMLLVNYGRITGVTGHVDELPDYLKGAQAQFYVNENGTHDATPEAPTCPTCGTNAGVDYEDADMRANNEAFCFLCNAPFNYGDNVQPSVTAKTAQVAPQVGDILYTNWGYDQTNVEFYQVTRVLPASVGLRRIGAEYIESGFMCGQTTPVKDKFISDMDFGDKEIVRRFRLSSEGYAVNIDTSGYIRSAWLWDGKSKYESHYAKTQRVAFQLTDGSFVPDFENAKPDYIEFWRARGVIDAERLRGLGWTLNNERMENQGWLDGMRSLAYDAVKPDGSSVVVRFYDSAGGGQWMEQMPSGGWGFVRTAKTASNWVAAPVAGDEPMITGGLWKVVDSTTNEIIATGLGYQESENMAMAHNAGEDLDIYTAGPDELAAAGDILKNAQVVAPQMMGTCPNCGDNDCDIISGSPDSIEYNCNSCGYGYSQVTDFGYMSELVTDGPDFDTV
jgi:hypothetical protein